MPRGRHDLVLPFAVLALAGLDAGSPASAQEPPKEAAPDAAPEAPPSPDHERIRALEAVVQEEAGKLSVLRARLDERVAAAFAGVELSGFAQIDLAFRQSSEDQLDPSGEPLNEDRFVLRRARLRAAGDFGVVGAALEADFNTVRGPQVRPINVEVTLGMPAEHRGGPRLVAATAGLFKIPFGLEVLESDRDRLFLERSTVIRALFPGEYDLGIRLAGSWRYLRYAVAVQNGNPLGDRQFPGRDPNAAKDVSGRVGVAAELGDVRFAAGASATAGEGLHRGTPATKDVVVWRDLNNDGAVDPSELQVIRGTAATPSINFDRFGFGADLRAAADLFGLGLLTVYGEIIVAQNLDRGLQPADPVSANRDLRELGWYVAAIQRLGPFAIGVRYDRYDPDSDKTGTVAGTIVPSDTTYSSLSAAVALVLDNARVILQGDLNRNHVGLDPSGVPGNLEDDALTVRVEMRF